MAEEKNKVKEFFEGLLGLIIVLAIVYYFWGGDSSSSKERQEELKKVKIVKLLSKKDALGYYYHRILVKNNTGKDIKNIELQVNYIGETKEAVDTGTRTFQFLVKKNRKRWFTLGDWWNMAALMKVRKSGKIHGDKVFVGEDNMRKIVKIKAEIKDFEYMEKES